MTRNSVSLRQFVSGAQFVQCDDIIVESVTADSRQVRPGDVFVAVKGADLDGHDYIPAAIAAGARAVVTDRPIADLSVPQGVVRCPASLYAELCMSIHSVAAEDLVCSGVTGTNGKTTTTWILRSILTAAGLQSGLLGTIEYSDGIRARRASLTTPSPQVLAQQLRQMLDAGSTHCSMEVSSHALAQQRCAGIRFSAAAITNVTHDHLDYHGSPSAYVAAKSRIAELLHTDAPLLFNAADAGCRQIADRLAHQCRLVPYAVGNASGELRADILSQTHRSQRIRLRLAQGDAKIRLRLVGQHNVENALAAAGIAEQLGICLTSIVSGIESVALVPGRLERIDEGQPFQVFVDYAHTPDAVSRVISAARRFAAGRIICVTGAGGDRDRLKRKAMGAACGEADVSILTSDNPRSEDPLSIISDVVAGMPWRKPCVCEADRLTAIQLAFEMAETGDVVLITGKGHETTQEFDRRLIRFDDRAVSRRLLRELQHDNGQTLPAAGFLLRNPA